MVEIGETAPDFGLYDADRKMRRLSEFLSKDGKTILAFYPGAFTGVCTQEMCAFRDMTKELETLHSVVVGISVDAPFAQKEFALKNGLSFPLLCDFKREAIAKYDLVWKGLAGLEGYDCANRAIFILDGAGKVVYRWVAENPGKYPDFEAIKKALA